MDKIVIITGANRGLGKAIVDYAIKIKNVRVVSLSRSINDEHNNLTNDKFVFFKTDLSEDFHFTILNNLRQVIKPNSKIYFINNASVILPIEEIGNLNKDAISISIKVNIEFPVNLINMIIKNFANIQVEIINITSGAADNPVPYWSLYSASKAFMKMFFKVLMEEQKDNKKIIFHNIDPGVLDTDMQREIREKSAPRQDYFTSLKEENKLIKPIDAAAKIFEQINFLI